MASDAWSFSVGERGWNRVRAFDRPNSGNLYLEFFGTDPETGEWQRKRISTGHSDKERAKQQAYELASRLAQGEPVENSETTLRTLFDKYLKRRSPQVGKDRQRYHRQMAELFCRYYGPEREVTNLNREDWDAFIEDRQSGAIDARGRPVPPSKRRSRSPNTVKKNLKALRAVLTWGVGADLLTVNPTDGYPLPSDENPNRPTVSQARYEAMLQVADEVDWRFKLALVLAHETGHRISAICELRWSDLNLVEKQVHWRGAKDKVAYDHATPLTQTALRALRHARKERPALGGAWVFPAPEDPSEPCSRHLMRQWWLRAEMLAELDHVRGLGWHGLRRKFADELRDASPKEIADLGGWKSPRTVAEVYQSSDLDAMRRAQKKRRTPGGNQ